ncbi:MAG: metal ABC transporter permease [Anaerolineae bacterium]|uniref:metal ABC transporter permease n=1 Tax=Promineifilum sp. TaxID=2664178 RepID=UPI001D9C9D71|nr:metal ABC transporter permease [Anaerolineales bacterium]MCO5180134.1 metal ABC transporter permease [Promineifilum sp.]MCW5847492.1 metal ABC transporter permease [Anaerolineae bacterium]
MLDLINSLLFDYTVRTVAMGAAVLGIVAGALGTFALLRRQSLLGDAMSHAALPGVLLAFMLTGSKAPVVLVLGAAVAGVLGTFLLLSITRFSRVKEDAALGIILSVFFGFGLVLLTYLQRNPTAAQAGLNSYLFGQAATLLTRDVVTMAAFGGGALLLLALFWKEFKLLSFDRDFGSSLGYPMTVLDMLLTTLLVIGIVIGLQAVGVVLMSALVVAPAAAARQWTDRLGVMMIVASAFGALAGVAGAFISSLGAGLSTGPVVVLVVSVIVLLSLLFGASRGLVWSWLQQQRHRRTLRTQSVLADLYGLTTAQHPDPRHPHNFELLRAMNRYQGGVRHSLRALESAGLVRETTPGEWALTDAGVARAREEQISKEGVK